MYSTPSRSPDHAQQRGALPASAAITSPSSLGSVLNVPIASPPHRDAWGQPMAPARPPRRPMLTPEQLRPVSRRLSFGTSTPAAGAHRPPQPHSSEQARPAAPGLAASFGFLPPSASPSRGRPIQPQETALIFGTMVSGTGRIVGLNIITDDEEMTLSDAGSDETTASSALLPEALQDHRQRDFVRSSELGNFDSPRQVIRCFAVPNGTPYETMTPESAARAFDRSHQQPSSPLMDRGPQR